MNHHPFALAKFFSKLLVLIVGAGFAFFFSSVALVEEFVSCVATQKHRPSKNYCCRPPPENRIGAITRQRKSPIGSNTMNIVESSAMAALGFALLTGNALAQQQQIRPTTTIDPRITRRSPAPIADTITAATTRHWGCCANPPAHTPTTAVRIDIHNLHERLRYARHELPEFLRSGYRSGGNKSHGTSGGY